MIDFTPRYAPSTVFILGHGYLPVLRTVFHPPGATKPPGCPLIDDCGKLELITAQGSRWWGFEKGYINSELRMVVAGFPSNCELRSKWPVVPVNRR